MLEPAEARSRASSPLGGFEVQTAGLVETDLSAANLPSRTEWLTPPLHPAAEAAPSKGLSGPPNLTQQDRQRYDRIRGWFDYVENLQPGAADPHNGLQKLTGYWNALRSEAMQGDPTALKILHALVLDQMHKELTAPSRSLVRFQYDSLSDLQKNVVDDASFAVEVQWRAMLGIRGVYNSRLDIGNPLMPDPQRFFQPVFDLLQKNPASSEIQRWGSFLLLDVFPRLLPSQQKQLAERFVQNFSEQPSGAQKLFALRCLPRMQMAVPHLAVWRDLAAKCNECFAQPDSAETKYAIIAMAFMGGAGIEKKIAPFLAPSSSFETQCAAAWSLGRIRSDKSFAALEAAVRAPGICASAQEMAIVSMAEYARTDKACVVKALTPLAAETEPDRAHVAEAAKSMLEKLSGRIQTQRDYFIETMLAPEQRERYLDIRAKYLPGLDALSLKTAQLNIVDRSLIPYLSQVERLVQLGEQHVLINQGSITQPASQRNMIGARSFDGRLWDTIRGIGSNNGQAVTPAYDLGDGRTNTFAHELMHHIHLKTFTPEMNARVTELFKEAARAKLALNYYAASNDREYLAVGNEAYDALYLDHHLLFDRCFNGGYDSSNGHTRAELKHKDRKLYDFLEEVRAKGSFSAVV